MGCGAIGGHMTISMSWFITNNWSDQFWKVSQSPLSGQEKNKQRCIESKFCQVRSNYRSNPMCFTGNLPINILRHAFEPDSQALEFAFAVSTGKGAALVAKKLGFEELFIESSN